MLKSVPFDQARYIAERQHCIDLFNARNAAGIPALRTLAKNHPHVAEPHFLLATAINADPPTEEMLFHAQRAAKLDPAKGQYRLLLGKAYAGLQLFELAIPEFRQAIPNLAHAAECELLLARALYAHGNAAESRATCIRAKAKELAPAMKLKFDHAQAHAAAALNLTEEAEELYADLVESGSEHADRALGALASLSRAGVDSPVGRLLDRKLAQKTLARSDRKSLLLAKGALHQNDKNHDLAFSAWRAARAISLEDKKPLRDGPKTYEDLTGFFTRPLLDAVEGAGSDYAGLIAIAGMPRSGTTLTEQIIATDDRTEGIGEFGRWGHLLRYLQHTYQSKPGLEKLVGKEGRNDIEQLAKETLEIFFGIAGRRSARIVEKMPHNFIHAGVQRMLFPKTRFVHVLRNPLDTFISSYQGNLGVGHYYAFDQVTYAKEFVLHARLMEYWKVIMPDQIFTLRYEELVRKPEETTRALFAFLNLDWHEKCLAFHTRSSTVRTLSRQQVRSPISEKSIGRWKNYEKHLGKILQYFRESDQAHLLDL